MLYLGVDGSANAGLTLPWLAVVPGAVAAACLTSPRVCDCFAYRANAGDLEGFAASPCYSCCDPCCSGGVGTRGRSAALPFTGPATC